MDGEKIIKGRKSLEKGKEEKLVSRLVYYLELSHMLNLPSPHLKKRIRDCFYWNF